MKCTECWGDREFDGEVCTACDENADAKPVVYQVFDPEEDWLDYVAPLLSTEPQR